MWLGITIVYLALHSCHLYNLKNSTAPVFFNPYQQPPPRMDHFHFWIADLSNRHLCKMTSELAKDTMVKLNMVKSMMEVRERQGARGKMMAGRMVAQMRARFKHMVQIYVQYANYDDMVLNNGFTGLWQLPEHADRKVKNYIYAYMSVESNYNELMMFHSMFLDELALMRKEDQVELEKDLVELNDKLGWSMAVAEHNAKPRGRMGPPQRQYRNKNRPKVQERIENMRQRRQRLRHRNINRDALKKYHHV